MHGTVTPENLSQKQAAPRRCLRLNSWPVALAGAGAALVALALLPLDRWPSWCLTRQLTGLPCPTCGMARSVHALLHGNIAESMRYHPLALVVAAAGSALLLCHLALRARNERGLPLWAWLAAAVLAVALLMVVWVSRLASGSIP